MHPDLPGHKTKLVCTIGPASDHPAILERMLRAGMNVARLNYSHGDFDSHARTIARLREASRNSGRRLAIMGDLSGPKMRIGELREEPIELQIGDLITLTTEDTVGDATRVSVTLPTLPRAVHPDDKLFLNDGMISLKVLAAEGSEVRCEVRSGGELRSRKGLNLPGVDLGISAFTERDRAFLAFSAEHGVDALSQSFVSGPEDVIAVREAAAALDYRPFLIAKIERLEALQRLDEILAAADGIMVARGDLGVEIPIARMPTVQKDLMRRANYIGKPVVTATQMLESMTHHRRPTRAEATDVANAILDGTDAVMLSGESAMGRYPVEAVEMLGDIAGETEPHRPRQVREERATENDSPLELIARSVQQTVNRGHPAAVVVPTRSGASARNITRFRLPVWITAFSTEQATCQALQFSYGILPVKVDEELEDWQEFTRQWLCRCGPREGLAVLTQGPSEARPEASYRMEVFTLRAPEEVRA
jgi:pyruvate kinase